MNSNKPITLKQFAKASCIFPEYAAVFLLKTNPEVDADFKLRYLMILSKMWETIQGLPIQKVFEIVCLTMKLNAESSKAYLDYINGGEVQVYKFPAGLFDSAANHLNISL